MSHGIIPPFMQKQINDYLQKDLEKLQKSDQQNAEQQVKQQQLTQQSINMNISNSIRERRNKIQDEMVNKPQGK